ncbi:hypothetical protein ACC754_40185, partial [Rhizobium johnstonii]
SETDDALLGARRVTGDDTVLEGCIGRAETGDRGILPDAATLFELGLAAADFINQGLFNPIDEVAAAGKWADALPKSIHDLITYDGK